MNSKVIVYTHYGVRNGYFGVERWQTWSHHPPVLTVAADFGPKRVSRWYVFLRSKQTTFEDEYARLDVALPLIIADRSRGWFWAALRWMGQRGLIHTSASPGCRTRLRDLRPGRQR